MLAKPTEIELTHNLATFEPLSLVSPPSGTYTGASLSFSNPEVVVVDPTTKAVTKLTATLASSTVNVPFSPSVTIGPGATVLNFDMNLASSTDDHRYAATVTPTFTVTRQRLRPAAKAARTRMMASWKMFAEPSPTLPRPSSPFSPRRRHSPSPSPQTPTPGFLTA